VERKERGGWTAVNHLDKRAKVIPYKLYRKRGVLVIRGGAKQFSRKEKALQSVQIEGWCRCCEGGIHSLGATDLSAAKRGCHHTARGTLRLLVKKGPAKQKKKEDGGGRFLSGQRKLGMLGIKDCKKRGCSLTRVWIQERKNLERRRSHLKKRPIGSSPV